jgi:hypothetical protein
MVARSVFERLEASGFRELTVQLTEEARAHGLAATVPARFTPSVGDGRGERICADTPSPILLIPVMNVPSYVPRVWESA